MPYDYETETSQRDRDGMSFKHSTKHPTNWLLCL